MHQEHAMNIHFRTTSTTVQVLGRAGFLRLARPGPVRLVADFGTLWVTEDGSPDDFEIEPGQSRDFSGQAPLTIGVLGGAARVRVSPLAIQSGWIARWLGLGAPWREARA
jgi:hypothetical protein